MKLIFSNSTLDQVKKVKQVSVNTEEVKAKLLDGSLDLMDVEYFSSQFGEWYTVQNSNVFQMCLDKMYHMRVKQRTIKVETPYYSPKTGIWYCIICRDDKYQVLCFGHEYLTHRREISLAIKDKGAVTKEEFYLLGVDLSDERWNALEEGTTKSTV